MAEWKFERRQGACGRPECAREFEDGERHASLLTVEDDQLQRTDLCHTCWRALSQDEGGQERALFWWFTRHSVGKKRTLQLDIASLEQLFVQLEGKDEPIHLREVRYVLCLLLMRKRRLKVEKVERSEEGESFLVKRPRRDERYRVFVVDLPAERLDGVRDRLQAIFDGAEAGLEVESPDASSEEGEESPGAEESGGDPAGAAEGEGRCAEEAPAEA